MEVINKIDTRKRTFASFLQTRRNILIEIIAALFIILFVYTAVNKLLVIKDAHLVLKDYPLIGNFPSVVAWGLPIAELIVVFMLFIPKLKVAGLYASFFLMTSFTLYLGYMLVFTNKLPCTCGGMLQDLTWPQHMIFNLVFIFLAGLGIRLFKMPRKNN